MKTYTFHISKSRAMSCQTRLDTPRTHLNILNRRKELEKELESDLDY